MRTDTQTRFTRLILLSVFTLLGGQFGCGEPRGTGEWPTRREVRPAFWCPAESLAGIAPVDAGTNDDCGPAEAFDAGTQVPDSGTLQGMSLDVYGLFTNPNPVGMQVPAGALKTADNILVTRPGVATPVKADDAAVVIGALTGDGVAEFEYAGQPYVWNGSLLFKINITDIPLSPPSVTYASVGALAWSGSLRHATAGGDLYLTSNAGPIVMDGVSGVPKTPGAPAAFDSGPNITTPSANGWLPNGASVGVRVVFGYNDAEGKPVLGEPSGRSVVLAPSSGGPFTTTYNINAPPGVTDTSGHFVQVYRTATAPAGVDPGDSYFLVYETPWVPTFPSGSTMLIPDIAPAGDVPLYTNPDRGGVRNSNVRPPLARDLVSFRDRLWLANTTAPHTLRLRMIAPPSGISEVVTIAGGAYTLATSAGTVSQQIEYAARDLVAQMAASNTTVRATYASSTNDPPGIIDFVSFTVGASAFTAAASNATVGGRFAPTIGTAVSSVATSNPNRLHYSKEGMPYGFPLSNTIPVGAQEYGISRIVALRDTLLVFKAAGGDGLWKVTGSGPFYVEQVNANVQLLAPNTVVVANNTAFAFTDKGLIEVSESGGVDTISVPIEPNIRDILTSRAATISAARAVVKEANSEALVYVGFPNASSSTSVVESYVWNINTETWTRDTRAWRSAYVDGSGRFVRFIAGQSGAFRRERDTGNEVLDRVGVSYAVKWNTETSGDPTSSKHFREVQVLFEQAQPSSVGAFMYFDCDGGASAPVETGGEGFPYIRAEVPFDCQRTSRLGVEIRGVVTTVPVNIIGMSASYSTLSPLKAR